MKIGLQLNRFDYAGGTAAIGPTLARVAREADEVGFDSIWVMDHFFQIRGVGPAEDPMLEGWTTLGFIGRPHAAGAPRPDGRRRPLPAARALGQGRDDARRPVRRPGVAWHRGGLERGGDRRGLGFPMPPLGERFEMLEETLQIAHAMWTGERGTEDGLRRAPLPRRRGC